MFAPDLTKIGSQIRRVRATVSLRPGIVLSAKKLAGKLCLMGNPCLEDVG
jgi:hypothetical protein